VDTVHDVKNGSPTGGGNYLVIPPCRLEIAGSSVLDSFFGTERIQEIYTPSNGWTAAPNTPYQYGSAWPWHTDKVNIVYTDGHAEVAAINQLTEGCETKPNWEGYITNSAKYKWALVSNP
jgi:prepilin-type processing-associated H-X9-DG protein